MKIGAHVSSSGGVDKAVDRALEMGAEAIQVFGGSPQTWRRKNFGAPEIAAFRSRSDETGIAPTFIHGVYLVNLATSVPENLVKSIEALIHDMNVCHDIGAKGVIFHLGSHRGSGLDGSLQQIVDSLSLVLAGTHDDTWLILENSAGMGGSVGSKFSELGTIMKAADNRRIMVCLDTQHMFASGYDVATPGGLEKTLDEFDREVGLERLVAVHANDSKCPLAGGVDRHENIGFGHIGRAGFENILAHPAFAEMPFLLEVPGIDHKGPDKANVDVLKDILADLRNSSRAN